MKKLSPDMVRKLRQMRKELKPKTRLYRGMTYRYKIKELAKLCGRSRTQTQRLLVGLTYKWVQPCDLKQGER